jgi:hypothetical protein
VSRFASSTRTTSKRKPVSYKLGLKPVLDAYYRFGWLLHACSHCYQYRRSVCRWRLGGWLCGTCAWDLCGIDIRARHA